MVCPSGTSSKTGVEPCQPCPVGYYQGNKGSKRCFRCSNTHSTLSVGSTQQSDCKAIDNCASQLCSSGATCVSGFNNYTCLCPVGWYGKHCDVEKNECMDDPCYGEALCIDEVGCEEKFLQKIVPYTFSKKKFARF